MLTTEAREMMIDAAECLKELARERPGGETDRLRSEAFQHAGRLEGIVRADAAMHSTFERETHVREIH